MLTQLRLEHFKCFDLLKLPIGRLTLLSGSNASGKSSVLQALVLIHQTIREQEWSTRLLFNGSELRLGTVTDLVDKLTGRRTFDIAVVDLDCEVAWTFEGDDRRDMSARVTNLRIGTVDTVAPKQLHFLFPLEASQGESDLANRFLRLCFLTAERIGPREVYSLEDPNSTQVVGSRGENAASLLHWERDSPVLESLVIEERAPTLLHQVEAHMREFFPGCSLEIQQVPQSNGVTLGLRTSNATDFHRPIHVGFGLTQVFPIVVAALTRKTGDFLLIENPEVHLHPAGQAKMGSFLSKVAAAGVQVIIETHSDHVLNGIRRSVRGGEIKSEEVAIHFFQDREQEGDQVISPIIDQTGNIDVWPSGFFDQFDKDMNHFAGWGS